MMQTDCLVYMNGLRDFITKWQHYGENCPEIEWVNFEKEDVQRSRLVARILDIFDNACNS
jgi:phosphate starvation-inducible protein PhoH